MTKTRSTKRALLTSGLVLIMCITMLIGSTFAWFTDSVTSSGNIIKSGKLDVTMEWADGTKAVPDKDSTDWIDASTGAIFDYDLWEPGYTEVRHIKIANEGTLALKYQLNIIANGEVSKLADVIDVYYVDPAVQVANRTELANAPKLGTLTEVLDAISTTASGELKAGEDHTVTLALKMQESAGNEYQNLAIGSDFAVQLLATQLTYEEDSFDNLYDEDAPFSLWNGTVPTNMPASLVVDGDTQTIHVKDADAFAYLSTLSAEWANLYTDGNGRDYTNYANGAGGKYYYSGQWTVSLEADIDLKNYVINPVNIMFGESTGATAFNGNGHTIRNINTTTGLFVDKARASFSNLNLINVKATNGALIGTADHNISNITVKNATISGTDYVGGLVGYTYGEVNGCKVIDSSVVATGKEAGGLVGYIATSKSEATITKNTVKNVTVYAGNRAAGFIAQVNVNVKVYGNTVDTVTVGAEDTSKYQSGAVVSNAIAPENVYGNTVTNANVAASEIEIVSDQADFKEVIKTATDDTTIVLGSDVTATTTDWDRYTGGMSKSVNIDGCGNTIEILTQITDPNYQAVLRFEKDAVIKNVVFDLSNANPNGGKFRAISSKGDLVVDNCTFIGNPAIANTRGIIFGEASGAAIGEVDVTITNCTFVDFKYGVVDNENGQDVKSVKIENCKFTNAGVNVSAGESITFTGNKLIDSSVRLVSYQNGDTVKVVATGNDLSESVGQVIAIMRVTNTANITKQDEFTIY